MLSLKIIVIGTAIAYGIAVIMQVSLSCINAFTGKEGGDAN